MIRDLSKYARRLAFGAMTALALFAGSATVQPVKAEPIAFILGATYLALGGGAICAVLDVSGNSVCQGRDNTEWASTQYGKMTPGAGYIGKNSQAVDSSYNTRMGIK